MDNLIKIIRKTIKEKGFTGVISVYSANNVVFSNSYGYRDVKNKIANDVKTKFGTASGTKLFTALGVGVLIDNGLLSLDTPMNEIDADFHTFIDNNATVLNLLTHKSGIYEIPDPTQGDYPS